MILDDKYLTRLELVLTTKCNFKCKLCTSAGMINGPLHEMDEALFQKIVQEIKQPTSLQFFGGEPLIYFNNKPHLYDIIFSNSNIFPIFITNGSLLHLQEKLLSYMESKPCNIVFSGESYGEGYEALRVGGNWDLFLSNIKLAAQKISKNKYLRISMNYIVTQQTIKELQRFTETMESIGVHDISPMHLIYSPSAEKIYGTNFNDHYIVDTNIYKEEMQKVRDFLRNKKSPVNFQGKKICGEAINYMVEDFSCLNKFVHKIENHKSQIVEKNKNKKPYCWMPFYSISIYDDGTVSACCTSNNLTLGNCIDNTIYEIFNNEYFDKIRNDICYNKPMYCCCTNMHPDGDYRTEKDNIKKNLLVIKYQEYIKQFQAMKEQDVDKAIEFLEEKEKETFDFDCFSSVIWNELAGVYLYRKKDYEKAKYYVEKILKISPLNILAKTKLGIIFIHQEKYNEALMQLQVLIEESNDPLNCFWLGYAYEKTDNLLMAIKCYKNFTDQFSDKEVWGYKHALQVIEKYENKFAQE